MRRFDKVWDEFSSPYPANGFLGAPTANPVVTFANGSTANLLTGPYNLKGFVPTNKNQLAGTPGAFVDVDNPRRIQFGLRLKPGHGKPRKRGCGDYGCPLTRRQRRA